MNEIPLTGYEWIYGSAQIGAVLLAIVAGFIALTLFQRAVRQKHLRAWKALTIALVLFALEEILGALRTFGVYSHPFLTHVIPSVILLLLIWALMTQISITKGWTD